MDDGAWVDTYRGTVFPWETDIVEHLTVAYYFERFADAIAKHHGATVVEINPQHTALTSRAQFALRGAAGAVLPELLRRLRK